MINKILFLKLAMMVCVITITLSVQATPVKPAQSKWSYVRKIAIKYAGEMLSNAVINIRLGSDDFDYAKAGIKGADIRFSTDRKLNGDGLAYWIEDWNGENGFSNIWVKLPVLNKGKNEIFIYYGNATARSAADGQATFLFFDDFEDGRFAHKWDNVSIGQVEERDGIMKLKESDGQVGQINAKYDVNGKVLIHTLYQREKGDQHWTAAGIGGWGRWLCFGDHTEVAGIGTNYLMFYDANSMNNINAKPIVKSPITGIDDKWHKIEYWYDGEKVGGNVGNVYMTWKETPALNFASKLALRTLDNDSWDNFAYIFVSPYINSKLITTDIGNEKKN